MQVLIWLILVIAALVVIFGLISFILQVTIVSFPAWCGAVLSTILTLYLFRLQRIHELNSHGTLSRMITVRFDGQRLIWSLDESQIEQHANADLAIFLSTTVGIISTWLILSMLNKHGAFQGITFMDKNVSPEVSIVMSCALSGIALITTIVKSKPKETLRNLIREHANYLVSRVNTSLERTEELRSIESAIKSLASQLKVHFPIDFQTELQAFVDAHKTELLLETTELNRLIEKNISRAREDKKQLEEANNIYQGGMKLYTETRGAVISAGYKILVDQLEYDYGLLKSENLMSLLVNRKWGDFHDMVNSIMMDLKRVHELAIKYKKEGYEEETERYHEETDEDKAYRVLGIPPAATNEQIKKAYKTLASIWHPDAKTVTDDTRFKEINWAYSLLRSKRQFV